MLYSKILLSCYPDTVFLLIIVQCLPALNVVFTTDHAFELPLSWQKMGDKENLKIVQLKPTDEEYKDVSQKFTTTSGGTKVTLIKVSFLKSFCYA